MREIKLEKVILNIAVGNDETKLLKAIKLLEVITNKKPIKTLSRKRIATWKIRPGLAIGCKVTLRKKEAEDILKRMLEAIDSKVSPKNFTQGSFSFGIKEYIQIPTVPYQREVGLIGLDVSVVFSRAGYRVEEKKIKGGKVGKKHRMNKEDSMSFAKEKLGVIIE